MCTFDRPSDQLSITRFFELTLTSMNLVKLIVLIFTQKKKIANLSITYAIITLCSGIRWKTSDKQFTEEIISWTKVCSSKSDGFYKWKSNVNFEFNVRNVLFDALSISIEGKYETILETVENNLRYSNANTEHADNKTTGIFDLTHCIYRFQ